MREKTNKDRSVSCHEPKVRNPYVLFPTQQNNSGLHGDIKTAWVSRVSIEKLAVKSSSTDPQGQQEVEGPIGGSQRTELHGGLHKNGPLCRAMTTPPTRDTMRVPGGGGECPPTSTNSCASTQPICQAQFLIIQAAASHDSKPSSTEETKEE